MGRPGIALTLIGVTLMLVLVAGPLPVHAASGLVQQNSVGCTAGSCAITITASFPSVSSGNVLVVGVYDFVTDPVQSISDTRSTSFASPAFSIDGTENVYIYYGTLSSSGPDTVTVTFLSTSGAQNVNIYEVSGVTTTGAGTGHDANTPSTSIDAQFPAAINVPSGAFVVGMIGTSSQPTVTPGTGFTLSTDHSGGFSHAQYSISGVASPTIFPATCSPPFRWAEAGLVPDPTAAPIPEYPFGLPLLAVLAIIAYGIIRRGRVTTS